VSGLAAINLLKIEINRYFNNKNQGIFTFNKADYVL